MSNAYHHVAVLGASPKPTRYANQCIRLLQEHDYRITPIHPKFGEIEGLAVTPSMADIDAPDVDLSQLADLQGTVELLRDVGAID